MRSCRPRHLRPQTCRLTSRRPQWRWRRRRLCHALLLDGPRRLFGGHQNGDLPGHGLDMDGSFVAGAIPGPAAAAVLHLRQQRALATNRTQAIGQAGAGRFVFGHFRAPKHPSLSPRLLVMAFDTNDDTYGRPSGWLVEFWHFRDQTLWTPSAATRKGGNGRLLDTPGKIRAGAALGSDGGTYKAAACISGATIGPPIWAWQRVQAEIQVRWRGVQMVVVNGTDIISSVKAISMCSMAWSRGRWMPRS